MGLPFPHENVPAGPVRCTVVDAIDVARLVDEPDTGAIYLTDSVSGRRLLWKFSADVGRQVAASILNTCDAIEGGR